nr:putative ORF1 [Marmot picobirnavirus]
MTRNQLQYFANQEIARSNRAKESQAINELAETSRSNLAREFETNRSNVAREQETHRSNAAQEKLQSERNRDQRNRWNAQSANESINTGLKVVKAPLEFASDFAEAIIPF